MKDIINYLSIFLDQFSACTISRHSALTNSPRQESKKNNEVPNRNTSHVTCNIIITSKGHVLLGAMFTFLITDQEMTRQTFRSLIACMSETSDNMEDLEATGRQDK